MAFFPTAIGLNFYIWYSLLKPLSLSYPILYGMSFVVLELIFLLFLWLGLVFFRSTANEILLFEKPLKISAYWGLGFLSFLFCFTLFRDVSALVSYPWMESNLFYSDQISILILILSVACFMIGAFNAQMRLYTPTIEVKIEHLPESISGLKIAHLSDIHLGTGPNVKQVRKLIDQALSKKPDLIVLTGDIIDGSPSELDAEFAEMARLKAPRGVYFVIGNHECYWNHQESIDAIKKLGITVLVNEGLELKLGEHTAFIAGLSDPAAVHFKGQKPEIPAPPTHSKFNLILVHQPQLAKKIADHPYHLQLSGHTHGGQFFPWNLAVKRMYPVDRGLGRLKNLWIYVNMGSGYWGPPIRLGSQCEVTELVVVRA